MGRAHVRMLCDTGAFCNCISGAFYNKHLASVASLDKTHHQQNLVAASGASLSTIGKVNANFKIGGSTFSADFFVVDHLTHDVILGVEFFERTDTLLDYKLKRLSLHSGAINTSFYGHGPHPYSVYLPENPDPS